MAHTPSKGGPGHGCGYWTFCIRQYHAGCGKESLADPYILGVSSGAALGATAAIIFGIGKAFGSNAIGMCAFMGAFAVSVLVQIIASIGGRANSVRLLLSGMAISAVCSAFSSFIIYLSPNTEGIKTITFWLMGSLAGAEWKNIYVILPAMILVTIFFVSRSRILNLMLLGDEVAITLGRDLNKDRHVFLLFSSLMVGLAVYCAGMIGFVGLVVPHGVRMILGTDHRRLIPIAAVVGAIFMIWADVACRVLIPKGELPIGILISVIGAPCFLYLLMRRSYGFGEKT